MSTLGNLYERASDNDDVNDVSGMVMIMVIVMVVIIRMVERMIPVMVKVVKMMIGDGEVMMMMLVMM